MKKISKKILTTSLIASFALTTALGVSVFAMPKAEADFSDFTMDTGASVKMDEATGIRFTANVGEKTQASLENATNIVFGTLISKNMGDDGKLTLDDVADESLGVKNLVTAVWADGADSYANSTTKKYNGAIVGDSTNVFPEEKYTTALNAVGYVKYTVDSVEYVEYTTNTANRSLAQAAANAVANGVEDTNGFLAGVLDTVGVAIEKESVDMVVGGKETVATSAYAQDGIVWDSNDKNVVTVENGVLTAVGEGTATVSVTLDEYSDSITVNVGKYVQGSMMMVRTNDATYELTTETISGRTGVYAYEAGTSDWTDRLAVYETTHPAGVSNTAIPYVNSVEAFNNMVTKNYRYVTFDFLMYYNKDTNDTSAELKVESMSDSTQTSASSRMDYKMNATLLSTKTAITNNSREVNKCISLWSNGVEIGENEMVYHTKWYTVVIDRENCKEPESSDVWSFISFTASSGKIYFDNVRYYGNKADCMDYVAFADTSNANYVGYDGSQLVWGNKSDTVASYSLATETVAGRTGAYKYIPNGAGWNDKLVVYESGHGVNGTNVSSFPFPDASAAYENLTNKGYNYITVDVCFSGDSGNLIRVGGPVSLTVANGENRYYVGTVPGSGTSTINNADFIKLYNADGTEVTTAVQAGVWYTLWFNHVDTDRMSGQWSALNICGQGVTYFDNVRYYSANPFA